MYVNKEEMIEAIDQMLANYSDIGSKYEYRDHDVDFGEPIVLEGLQEIRAEIFGEEESNPLEKIPGFMGTEKG